LPNKDGWVVSQDGDSNHAVNGQAWNWNPPATSTSKVDRDATHTNWDSDNKQLNGLNGAGAVGGADLGVNGGVVNNNIVGGDDWFVR
jgi:hypothetical protein